MSPKPETADRKDAARRALRFIYAPFEGGAPAVDPTGPFGSPDALTDLARIAGTDDASMLRRLYADVMNGLPAFVAAAAAALEPGRYGLDDDDGARLRGVLGSPEPGLEDDSFVFTKEHALVLPRQIWGFSTTQGEKVALDPVEVEPEHDEDGDASWPVPFVSFKRPYGDMTYYVADMAKALGVPVGTDTNGYASLPAEVEARLTTLHYSTPAALRVLVLYGYA